MSGDKLVCRATLWNRALPDEPDCWAVEITRGVRDQVTEGDREGFASAGVALDWAIKWARDRGLTLFADMSTFDIRGRG